MNNKIIKILIPAVGGQGGGILTEWLFQTFLNDSYEVQGVSLPGMSQRGGSTVYYLEAYKSDGGIGNVVFSQHPVPGDIDFILSQEYLELGRALEQGFGSDKTTIVTSTHRIYSTSEKLAVNSAVYSDENLEKLATEFSSKFIGVDALQIAKDNQMDDLSVNAILLGIFCASNSLPLNKESYVKSIGQVGVATDNNLKAFELGYSYKLNKDELNNGSRVGFIFNRIKSENLDINKREREKLESIVNSLHDYFPEFLNGLISEALIRLTDYQDINYAESYLESLKNIAKIDKENPNEGYKITEEYLKNLALLMSYEDGIRVAELKIRSNRFKKIKEEMNIKDGQVYRVVDYLKPDFEEIYGLLPNFLISPFIKEKKETEPDDYTTNKKLLTLSQKPTTTAVSGFLTLWLLSKFKFIRTYSFRYKKEMCLFNTYSDYLLKFAAVDYELASIIAESGRLVKGYGRVRRRTINSFYRFLENVVDKLYNIEKKHSNSEPILTKTISRQCLDLIAESEKGIVEAEKLSDEALK